MCASPPFRKTPATTGSEQQTASRKPQAASRSRGSTLLLVLAALLLCMILGLTYLEVVRMDRRSTANVLNQGVPQAVLHQLRDQIADRLAGDLGVETSGTNSEYFALGKDGDVYDTGGTAPVPADYPGAYADTGSPTGYYANVSAEAEERYDFPGDKDVWLAPSAPEGTFSPAAGTTYNVFPQVSNITLPSSATPFVTPESGDPDLEANFVADYPRGHNARSINAVATRRNDPGDADGDGITDSRPQEIGYREDGLTYYAWCRIIDNSSMINLNTAHPITTTAGHYLSEIDFPPSGPSSTDDDPSPRWRSPGEVDITKLFACSSTGSYDSLSVEAGNNLTSFFSERWLIPTGEVTTPLNWNSQTRNRSGAWNNSGRYEDEPGTDYFRFDYLSNERSLRHRNGLNTAPGCELDHPIDSLGQFGPLYDFIRKNTPAELTFQDYVDYEINKPGGWMSSGVDPISAYFRYEPRHQFTTHSGHSAYRKNYQGESGRQVKHGLTKTDLLSSVTTLRDELDTILNDTSGDYTPPGSFSLANKAFASRLAVNIMDYFDKDVDSSGNPTTVLTGLKSNGPTTHYGLEAIPFIAEVYVQHAYNMATTTITVGAVPPLIPGTTYTRYTWTKAETGYAIELRNPFNHKVYLSGLKISVGGVEVALDHASLNNGTAKTEMAPYEIWVIKRDSGSTSTNDNISNTIDQTAGPGLFPAAVITTSTNTWFTSTNAGVIVTLSAVTDKNGTAGTVVYQQVNYPALVAADSYGPYPALAFVIPPTGTRHYKSLSAIGGAYGVAMMSVGATGFSTNTNLTDVALTAVPAPLNFAATTVQLPTNWTANDALGEEGLSVANDYTNIKGFNGPAGGVGPAIVFDSDPSHAQFVLRNDAIESVHELLMVPLVGPTSGSSNSFQTVAEVWGTRNTIADFYLDHPASGTASGDNPTPVHELLDAIMFDSPVADDLDNDQAVDADSLAADSNADDGLPIEMFQRGTINLNTMPKHLLESWLPAYGVDPHGSSGMAVDLAQAIVDFRNDTTRPGGTRAGFGGFASTGEFLLIEPMLDPAHQIGGDGVDTFEYDDDDGDPATPMIPIDYIGFGDAVADDAEETTMMARMLTQIGAVRSDTFTAYILVRGYRGESLTPEVQVRGVFLMDRSRVIQSGDKAKVHTLEQY